LEFRSRELGARIVCTDRFLFSVYWLTRTNREPEGQEVPTNLCHRDKDYGNWNKNEPVFKIPVFIYLAQKIYPQRLKTPNVLTGSLKLIRRPDRTFKIISLKLGSSCK
jgi:hypothetical protein